MIKNHGFSKRTQQTPSSLPPLPLKAGSPSVSLSQPTRPVNGVVQASRSPTRALSSFLPLMYQPSVSLLTTLQVPSILAAYILHLDWIDAYPLLTTCKTMRDSFQNVDLRDVILSRYVPGYAQALPERYMRFYQHIQISVHDLDQLLLSQRVPIHRYPMHALRMLTSLFPTFEDDEVTRKYVSLTQSHSRFVLLLQSIVHSSLNPVPPEPEEKTCVAQLIPKDSLRELTFPPPLAYTRQSLSDISARGAESDSQLEGYMHRRKQSETKGSIFSGRTTPMKMANGVPSTKSISSMTSGTQRLRNSGDTFHKRRLSIFSQPAVPHPPPQEPRTLTIYGNTWRRGTTGRSSVDENGFVKYSSMRRVPPAARTNHSSDSSISDIPVSSNSSADRTPTWSSPVSPHNIHMATSRIRAPILRVFVPCSQLEDGDVNVVACEQQLVDAGLWEHLSTGDIVCNLGYVPQTSDDSSSEGHDSVPAGSNLLPLLRPSSYPHSSPTKRNTSPASPTSQRKWLIFNGEILIPYTPPDLIPLDQPLSLPSPFYYAHIMPPAANPQYIITRLPVCDDVPQLRLIHSTRKVPSPHSPKGYALVKRYGWTARVVRLRVGDEGDMGDGWFGEWVLEYDGTEEGKQILLDALGGKELGRRRWEVVREKSSGGKLWLRLLAQ